MGSRGFLCTGKNRQASASQEHRFDFGAYRFQTKESYPVVEMEISDFKSQLRFCNFAILVSWFLRV